MDNSWPSRDTDTALAEVMRRLDIGDELLWMPERLVSFEHWVGHIPFAFWLVKVLRPRLLVELGTHRGNSYCAFCQAVSRLQLNCRALAIDTWQGDEHMEREEGLLADLREHHDPRYDSFSSLLEMTFDMARAHVTRGTVDLLHLDGTHTYDAVRHDFENWRDSVSSRGVALFHDISVHREEFGVWRLWEELSREYPSFAFLHSYGLGVLGLGSELPLPLRELFDLNEDPDASSRVRALFEVRGRGLVARLQAEQMASRLKMEGEAARTKQARLAATLRIAEETAATLKAERNQARTEQTQLTDALHIAEAEASRVRAEYTAATAELVRAREAHGVAKSRSDAALRNLRVELDRLARDAAQAQSAEKMTRERSVALVERLTALETSTFWQVTWPIRRALAGIPPDIRRTGRRTAKILWWAVTLRLPAKLRALHEARNGGASERSCQPPLLVSQAKHKQAVVLPNMSSLRAFTPRGRIAAVAHVHYPELWPDLREALSSIHERIDVFVSVTEGVAESAVSQIQSDFPHAQVFVFPNLGRDILPFLTFAASGVLNRYDLVCKLHTKRTLHRGDGDSWRELLLGGILADRNLVRRIVAAFEADPDLGIVVADGHVFGSRPEHWVDNRARVLELGARIGLENLPDNASFPGGSIFWIRPFLLRTIVALKLGPEDFEPEPLPRDGSTAHAVERLIGLVCAEAGMRIEESGALSGGATSTEITPVRIVAYYLPQYHPVPENDAWWGAGFTEWVNVTRARPMFPHHRQPRLPADLGFYDLRVPDVREAQAQLARRYGVGGFCYYFYWFNGRGILRRPLEEMIASGRPDFPFMLCWANEPWTRNWDGGEQEVLLPQDYEPGWPRAFAQDILPFLADQRYLRVGGIPMLLIYRVMHIPDRVEALAELRDELRRLGMAEVHLSGGWVGFAGDDNPPENPAEAGLDSWFEFPPHRLSAAEITATVAGLDPQFSGKIYSYRSAVEHAIPGPDPVNQGFRHRAVMVGWDNTARRMSDGRAFHGATPALFRRWLRATILAEAALTGDSDRVVFVNAWNEWAEGTYLEPDRDFGHGWLEAVASALGISMMRPAVIEPDPASTSQIAGRKKEASIGALAAQMSDAQWLELMIRSAEAQQVEGAMLPAFPAPAWQASFVGSSNAHAMQEAAAFQDLVDQQLALLGDTVSATSRILDFGCGWGRHIRLRMKRIPAANLFGVDVDPDMIGFCRISGLPAQFSVIPPFGPTPFDSNSFDLIYAYSVFSHLAEPAHVTWAREFRRILRPGATVVFTTEPRRFLAWTKELRTQLAQDLSAWELSLRTAFPEPEHAIADYDAGRFVFAATGGGEHRPSTFYGEAAVPEAWLRQHWEAEGFALRAFIDDPACCQQAVAVMQAT